MRKKNREFEDIVYFGEKYFAHFLTEKTSEFHRDMFAVIEKNTTDRIDILAPRGHAKSTWLSIIYPIWKICYNREINILIISDTQEQADKFLRAIKDELEMNEKLIETYGEFYQETQKGETSVWRATSIIVKREKRSKEDTITCGGTGKRIIGKRADLIIVDDPLNDENTANEKQREKTKRWFYKTLTPIIKPEKNKKIIVIGTRKHANDLHQELSGNEQYETRIYKAIDENERPLWKEKFNLEKLLKIKNEIGSTIFAQEYQNEPVDDTNSLFRREWIKNCKNEKATFINMVQRKNERRRNILVITGWDLSIVMDKERAERSDTDYTVGITILYDKELKTRRIINIYRERGITPGELLAKVEEINYRYDEDMIIIENNLFQILYSYQLLVTTDLPVIGHTTTQKDKINLYEGIPAMSILFENKKYVLPVKEKEDIRLIKILEDELVGLGYEDHDDTVMALWFVECGISKYKEIEMNLEIIDDPTM